MNEKFCRRRLLALVAVLAATARPAGAESLWEPELDVAAFAALRVARPDEVRVRDDGGEGRLRYGDGSDFGNDVIFSPAEVAIEVDAAANSWLSLFLHGQYQPEGQPVVGLVRGFVEVEPPPWGRTALRFKGGAFFPGVSRTNRDAGWASVYTLTNSPSHSWIADDIRPIGVAAAVSHYGDRLALSLEGAVFFANDVSGGALAVGGWVLHDFKNTLGGELHTFDWAPGSTGPAVFDPFRELDDEPGYQILAEIDVYRYGGVSLLYWDNRGEVSESRPGKVIWNTSFFAADVELGLPLGLKLLPQVMVGQTENPEIGSDFWTVSALLSRDFDALRVSARYDHFEQDTTKAPVARSLDEDGDALTAAAFYFLGEYHRFAAELVYVVARRDGAEPPSDGRKRELLFQLEYRISY